MSLRSAFERWIWAGCFWFAMMGAASAANVTAALDRNAVNLGETVTLSITFDGTTVAGVPSLPPLAGLRIVGTGQRTEMDLTRGIRRQVYQFQLQPTQTGQIAIPSLSVNVGGETFNTSPLTLNVAKPGSTVNNPATGAPTAELRLTIPTNQVYLGQVIPVEIELYVQEGRLIQLPEIAADGFTITKPADPVSSQVQHHNQVYNRVVFKLVAIPAKTGLLTLGPATLPLSVPDLAQRPEFFFGRPQKRIELRADPVALNVRGLPTNDVPPTFSGAVGQFNVGMVVSPTKVAVGDPITVLVQVTGQGALEGLRLPPQPAWSDFKTYPSTEKIEGADPFNISGAKIFEQAVVPQNANLQRLPGVQFSFFDPQTHAYRTVSAQDTPLVVQAAAAGGPLPAPVVGTNSAAPPAPELVHIKPHLGQLNPAGGPWIQQAWYWLLLAAAPAGWLALLWQQRRAHALHNNPRLRRRRQADAAVAEGLMELKRAAAAQDTAAFFSTVFRLLQERIGERLDLPAASITEAAIDDRLVPRGLDAGIAAELHQMFQLSNQARYSAQQSPQELAALIPRVEKALADLQQWNP